MTKNRMPFFKLFLIIGIVLGVVFAVGIFLFMKPVRLPIEQTIPQGALVYIQVTGLEEDFKSWKQAEFWQEISKINIDRLPGQSDVVKQQARMFTSMLAQIPFFLESPLAQKLIGKDFALALYPFQVGMQDIVDMGSGRQNAVFERFLSNMVLVTKVPPEFKILDQLGLVGEMRDESLEEQVYLGQKYYIVTVPQVGIRFSFTRIGDALVLGVTDKMIRQVIETRKNHLPVLADDEDFQKARGSALKDAGQFVFVSLEKIVSLAKEHFSMFGGFVEDNQNIEEKFEVFKGLRAFAMSLKWGELDQAHFRIFYDHDQLHQDVAKNFALCEPRDNQTIDFVPDSAVLYNAGHCFDLASTWEQFQQYSKESASGGPSVARRVNGFLSGMGLSVEQHIVPFVGDEFGWFVKDVRYLDFGQGMTPIPDIVLFVKINAQAQDIQKKIEDWHSQSILEWHSQTYLGHEIKYSQAVPGNLNLAFTVAEPYVLFSLDKSVLEAALDTQAKTKSSLRDSIGFDVLDAGLSADYPNLFFLDLRRVKEILVQMSGYMRQWNDKEVAKRQAFLEGSEKKVEEIRQNIQQVETDLADLKAKLGYAQDDLARMKAENPDAAEQQTQIIQMETEIKQKTLELQKFKEQETAASVVVQSLDQKFLSPQDMEIFIEDIYLPIARTLGSFRGILMGKVSAQEGIRVLLHFDAR